MYTTVWQNVQLVLLNMAVHAVTSTMYRIENIQRTDILGKKRTHWVAPLFQFWWRFMILDFTDSYFRSAWGDLRDKYFMVLSLWLGGKSHLYKKRKPPVYSSITRIARQNRCPFQNPLTVNLSLSGRRKNRPPREAEGGLQWWKIHAPFNSQ